MKILLVDDEPLQLMRLEKAVKDSVADADLFCYGNPVEAYAKCTDQPLDIAFLDIEMPG